MANVGIRFVRTTRDRLPLLEKKDGQLIFVEDDKKIYLDNAEDRVEYGQVITLVDDIQREGIIHPIKSIFYFVQSTNSFWRYDNQWIILTSPFDPEILFIEDLPPVGRDDRLYIKDSKFYQWDNKNGYKQIGGSFWENMRD